MCQRIPKMQGLPRYFVRHMKCKKDAEMIRVLLENGGLFARLWTGLRLLRFVHPLLRHLSGVRTVLGGVFATTREGCIIPATAEEA